MVTERLLEALSVVLRTQDAVRHKAQVSGWNPLGIEGLCSATHLFLSREVEHEENVGC